jgi:hypothetical protein
VLEARYIGADVAETYLAADEQATALRLLTEATEEWSERYPDLAIHRRVIEALHAYGALSKISTGSAMVVVGGAGSRRLRGAAARIHC